MNISGNTILITGGTSGIGLALAEKFVQEGNTVIITGRRINRLDEIRHRIPEIIIKESDVNDDLQRVQLLEWVSEYHPDLNILINNAGVQLITDFNQPLDLARVRLETETNFIAPLHLSSLFIPILTNKPNAAIINISSGLAFTPIALMAVYCATKAAIHSLSLSLRFQLKHTGIKVFEIAPPSVDTELGHDRRQDKSESHGGIPVDVFVEGALKAIANDEYEAAIGQAEGLRLKREQLFEQLNQGFR